MATPSVTVDGTTPFNAANMNKYINAGAVKTNVALRYARIRWNGAALEVSTNADSAVIISGDLTFNAGNTSVDITLAGLTNPPLIVVSPAINTAYYPQLDSTSLTNVLAQIEFYDRTNLSTKIVTGTADTNMDLNLWLIGE